MCRPFEVAYANRYPTSGIAHGEKRVQSNGILSEIQSMTMSGLDGSMSFQIGVREK